MKFPIIELFDRYAIACVKWDRTQANQHELEFYQQQIDNEFNLLEVQHYVDKLKEIHNKIWDLEWQLRQGLEDELGYEIIGRRAVEIRNYNNKRVEIKNRIAEHFNSKVKEIKINHLSQ